MVARGAVYVSRRQIERCESECSFLSEDFNTETMECVIPIVCPEEVDNFLKCAEKNKNDYGAAACQSLGKELARKMAQTMGDLSIVIEKEGSQN
jgi:hypothetical protein